MNRASMLATAALCTVAGLTVLATVAGCGSSNRTIPIVGTAAAAFAGRSYSATVPLGGSQTGVVAFTPHADGTAAGTLTISDGITSRAAKSRGVIATPFLSGTFNPVTGALSLTGSYTVNGVTIPISFTGILPIPPATTGGSFALKIGDQSYSGVFGALPSPLPSASPSPATSPTPGATPTPQTTPTPSPQPTPSAIPGTLNQLIITREDGSAANNRVSTLNATNVTASGFLTAAPVTGGGSITVNIDNNTAEVSSTASLSLEIATKGPLTVGTFPVTFANKPDPSTVLASYLEYEGGTRAWQSIIGTGTQEGQIIIEQVDTTKVRVHLINVRIYAKLFQNSTGTLRVNGTVETTKPPFFVN